MAVETDLTIERIVDSRDADAAHGLDNGRVLTLTGAPIGFAEVMSVAYDGVAVTVALPPAIRNRFDASRAMVTDGVAAGRVIYGVTTCFGGMADQRVDGASAAALQAKLLAHLRPAVGEPLSVPVVRAAMLLRVNSHLHGVSGLRMELVTRLVELLNLGITPVVLDLGSIGASGDLVPLAAIAGAAIGADGYEVLVDGRRRLASDALSEAGLEPMRLQPKEGLAMVNGTSVSTAWALDCILHARRLFAATLGFHALAIVALGGDEQAFAPFIHAQKPHRGQQRVAAALFGALDPGGNRWLTDHHGGLAQDRYSVRCLPQFLGPVLDTIERVADELIVEANSATDNPLFDAATDRVFHGGNFLAQYVATGLDSLRAQIALLCKHADVQFAQLMNPAFSSGLPPSLVGRPEEPDNAGLKGVQIVANSVMPLVTYRSAPLADRFPTHAEQHNQNINSQSYGSARLTDEQLSLAQTHLACALLASVQAVELRATAIPAPLRALDAAVRRAAGVGPGLPVLSDGEQNLQALVGGIVDDLRSGGEIDAAVAGLLGDQSWSGRTPGAGSAGVNGGAS